MAKENRLRKGSNTKASGCTQGSVSATHMLVVLVLLRMSTISFPDNIILSCGDFLAKRGVPNDVCVVIGTTLLLVVLRDDEGATNAAQLATRKEIIMLTTKTNFATLFSASVMAFQLLSSNKMWSRRCIADRRSQTGNRQQATLQQLFLYKPDGNEEHESVGSCRHRTRGVFV
eukprot:scaffold24236_cov49-Attheya_sp.AAC.2